MARIRSVSPELRTSETCAAWSRETRYAWVLLWGYLDDHGRGQDNAKVIAADCFPLDDDVTGEVMAGWLDAFEAAGSICRYEHDGKRWLHATKWGHWQKPQHPSKVRQPPCSEHEPDALAAYETEQRQALMKVSGKSHEALVTVSPTSKEGEGEKELSRRGSAPAAQPPKPPRCFRHSSPALKTRPPCGECKELRIAWENGNNLDRPALAAVPKQLACPEHPGQFAGSCSPCRSERIGAA
jgi:hypothetical protein